MLTPSISEANQDPGEPKGEPTASPLPDASDLHPRGQRQAIFTTRLRSSRR